MIMKKQKRKLKKIKVAIFISDVGFGHMVRQREVIHQLIDKINTATGITETLGNVMFKSVEHISNINIC